MLEIIIDKATENDLASILALQKDCYLSEAELYNDYDIPPLLQDQESIVREYNKGVFLKAVLEGEIVGSVRAYTEDETCYIGKLIVKETCQNRGIGKMLLNAIESLFSKYSRFELFTGYRSEKNLYLYKKIGYKEFKDVYINDNLKIVYLEKER